jgi:hypothetical protein
MMDVAKPLHERVPQNAILEITPVKLSTLHELYYRRKVFSTSSASSFLASVITYSKERWHNDFGNNDEYVVATGAYYYDIYVPINRRVAIFISPYASVLIQRSYLRSVNEKGLALDVLDNSYIPSLPPEIQKAVDTERNKLFFSKKACRVDGLLFRHRSAARCFKFICNESAKLAPYYDNYKTKIMSLFAQQAAVYCYRVFKDDTGYIITHHKRTRETDGVCIKFYEDFNPIFVEALKDR